MIPSQRHAKVLVNDEGLAILSLLKVQSGPMGNLRDTPFDGDEMNLHAPQNILAETELRHLAATPYQMISPSANAPIIGIYQDSLLGSYRFTRPGITFSPREAMNLLMMFPKVDVNKLREKGDKITNFDVLSQILSPLTLKYKTKLFDEDENYESSNNVLEIRNGEYIRGQIEKSVLASTTKGIIHRICNDYGHMAAANFIDDLQNVITEYMKSSSFSVGISDLIANTQTQESIINIITEQKQKVQALIEKVHLGIFENNTATTNMTEFENNVNNILNDATNQAGKIGRKSLNKSNRFVMIVDSGSKGTPINISQMISCLGQTNVDGKRIPYGFDNRTLPHFNKFDDSPGARGFIENSYISGLTAPELFFHAMGGRIGLIDTACKSVTWETPIVILENDKPKYIEIGKWIDAQLDAEPEKVKHFTERQMELLDIEKNNIYIPTTDENGVVTWSEITAVTRHDPGVALYEIKTHGGRSVIVTESKSLLIWNSKTKTLDETSTPDIKIGDCVPVTGELCKPPIISKYIDVSGYLPKTEFVYGTEFNIATEMMKNAMENRKKIPVDWWNDNNNKNFTLPYKKKSSLQRTLTRSNIDNIKDGYVYPYHAIRRDAFMPEKFELNEENGIFLGIYLAEGHSNNCHVTITNNNVNIRLFVKSWFDKFNISYVEKSKINKIGGTTTTITGNSSVLSKFLSKLVGHKAENKFVPSEAFVASNEFIIGLLNGYYSGDGSIGKNSIDVGSASKRLVEGVAMLCSRLGIFGRISTVQMKENNLQTKNIKPTHRFTISAHWAHKFSNQISFIEEIKNEKLKTKKWHDKKHMNFDTYNNIVLDKITEINILGIEKYPKVYDLTIPSTLNFGLANGLQVRDTSQTGYIQRRLIKGLEDLKVEYDMTVRNNKGKIIQFAYGDDGFDSTRAENQTVPLVGMSTEDIYVHYDITGINDQHNDLLDIYAKGTLSRLKRQRAETKEKCMMYIQKMIDARDVIVKAIFKNKNDNTVKVPVSFQSMIANMQGQLNLNANSIVDITPLEAFELMEEYMKKLHALHYAKPTPLFEILYYYYLTPKDLLVNKRFHRKGLTLMLENVLLKYKQSIVHPGEMVGVIAGQSIGEPTTQLTLNSVTYETEILVRNSKKEIKRVQIGDFTKEGIAKSKKIDRMEDKDTTYAELSEFYEVPSASEEGQTVWRRIEAVTRHPVINEDGTNTMLKIITEGNREIIATKAKSFLQLIEGKIQGVNGKDLKIGDYLPVSTKPLEYNEKFTMNVKELLPPSEYLYGSELEKAKSVMHEHHWWMKHSGKTFTLPHARSDSVVVLFKEKTYQGKTSIKAQSIKPDCVYMKLINMCEYTIPENIPLDYEFGYLVGAYCAEGCMTKHQISIANNDDEYLKPIESWCERYNITTKIYTQKDKIQQGWTSQDIRIYNTLLCRILENLCGKLSHGKFVSDKILFSNQECILGFLDAYIGGDGCVHQHKRKDGTKRSESISVTSVSYPLLMDVQIMLKNIGIIGKIYKLKKIEKNNRGTLPENIKQGYTLVVANQQGQKLAKMLNMKPSEKNAKCKQLLCETFKYEYCTSHMTVPNIVNSELVMEPRNDRCKDMEFDKIISIEEVLNTTNYAYDLTVEDTRNFDCVNGVCLRDTFHLSGVASKSNVTRGVPRIEEILRLTKNPKNPSLTVHLKQIDEEDQDKATKFANMLEHTKLIDVVKSVQICFDPNDKATTIDEDRLLMEQFYEFENMVQECSEESADDGQGKSKWIVRIEMDAESLLDKNITMDDIHFTISNSYSNDIKCVYSDYNASNLIFRIRLNSNVLNKSKKQKGIADTLDQSDEIYLLRNFQDTILNNIVLRGIPGIRNVMPRKLQNQLVMDKRTDDRLIQKEDGKFVKKDTWILDTTGSNLLDVLALDFVDGNRTFSNDINEIFLTLGIEAARQILYNEFVEVMEFSDVYINYHHLSLLCDRMTSTQNMVSIFRSGILNDDIGPISKSTFEVHTEVLLKASRHAEFDHMRGVSASVMMGQHGSFGTGSFNLVLDMKEMENAEDLEVDMKDKNQEIEKLFGGLEDRTDVCAKNNVLIQNNLAAIKPVEIDGCEDDYDIGF
jgi:DNA-directed RNA polymerase beta' subunit